MKFSLVQRGVDPNPVDWEMSFADLIENVIEPELREAGGRDGMAFVPATFGERKRSAKNAVAVESLAIEFHGDVGELDTFLEAWPYESVAWSDFNHTPERPCFVLLSPLQYPVPASWYRGLFEWSKSITCGVYPATYSDHAAAVFYLPRRPSGALGSGFVKRLNLGGQRIDGFEVMYRAIVRKEGQEKANTWAGEMLREAGLEDSRVMERVIQLEEHYTSERSEVGKAAGSAFKGLVADLSEVTKAKIEKGATKRRPNEMGERMLRDHVLVRDPDGYTYEWDERCWVPVSRHELDAYALQLDRPYHTNVTRRRETIAYAMAKSQRPEIKWNQLGEDEVPLRSGVLNVITFNQREHNRNDWLDFVVPHFWEGDAECPLWYKTMGEWFDGDPDCLEKQMALQEFFGYALLTHALYKKACVLYGDPDTGKSAVITVLTELVGSDQTCSIDIESMDDPRLIAPIKGKSLNTVADLTSKSVFADGGFKRLVSSGDRVMLDPKYGQPFLYQPHCVHLMATNSLPRITDETEATYSRLLLLRFNNRIAKADQNPMLERKLINDEMPGILRWAIHGAARLVGNRGMFTRIPEAEELIADYRAEQNPAIEFIAAHMVDSPGSALPFDEFAKAFTDWYSNPRLFRGTIGKWVRAAGVTIERRRDEAGRRRNFILDKRLTYTADYGSSSNSGW